MPDAPERLRPTPDEIAETLSLALRYDGRRWVEAVCFHTASTHHADEVMVRITAERLVEHLKRSGFVVMKRPGGGGTESA